ncbi:hypothetical protein DPMN_170931 [Dreissena polymorpha]|uniref:Uncharacterized protein n=1 Tax=Dreissena polymorpha TaxID=45954 RepID=A0A9D4IEQ1_DREPO|nr:hypothetical protein DPMN_170931 [Dreissena polymorpha]
MNSWGNINCGNSWGSSNNENSWGSSGWGKSWGKGGWVEVLLPEIPKWPKVIKGRIA